MTTKQPISHGVLGESTNYPKTYNQQILYPISRKLGRDEIYDKTTISTDVFNKGIDWWHCFEISWLNPMGISQVAMARLAIPADSEFIIESKSLKLYLNSFNLTEFDGQLKVQQTIEADLSHALKTTVAVDIISLTTPALSNLDLSNPNLSNRDVLHIAQPSGKNIDHALDNTAHKIAIVEDVSADMLKAENQSADTSKTEAIKTVETIDTMMQSYHSHLLRSNCPVTDQPDWGTVQIDIDSVKIDEASLLEYILTYRQHNGFHEQCVEQIFADLTQLFKPKSLMVRAWYTRRGGIDINPCRVSDISLLPQPSRLIRQ